MRPRLRICLLISLLVHFGVALLLAGWTLWEDEPDKVGSRELDIELVAPRLAPPPRNHNRKRGVSAGGTEISGDPRHRPERRPAASDPVRTDRAVASAAMTALRPPTERASRAAAAPQRSSPQRSKAQRRERPSPRPSEPQRGEQPSRLDPSQAGDPDREDRSGPRPADSGELPAASKSSSKPDATVLRQVARSMRRPEARALPLDPNPISLLTAVQQQVAARAERRRSWQARRRRQQQRLQQRWARLTRRTASEASPSGGGRPGQQGRREPGRPGGAQVGFRFYLSGQPSPDSKVVVPPELVEMPRVTCKVSRGDVTPATVRMLVTLEGGVDVAYIKHSSGEPAFDRCALRQVRGMRFNPGTDAAGQPLDVWIHVRVSTNLSLAALPWR